MDEVHYLADRTRGAVWEEVIIHLPESVALVSLSATVSNAEEFGEWLGDRARRDRDDRGGAAAGAAVPARDGGHAAVRPVRRRGGPPRVGGGGAKVNPRAAPGGPRRLGEQPDARPRSPKGRGQRGRGRSPGRQRPAGLGPEPGRGGRAARPRRRCCRRSCSSSAGSAATPRSSSACNANLRLTTPEERDEIFAVRRGALRRPPRRGPPGARLPRVPRRADPRHRRPPRRHAADVQGVRRGAVPARAVPGRVRHRDAGARASTCRPARW